MEKTTCQPTGPSSTRRASRSKTQNKLKDLEELEELKNYRELKEMKRTEGIERSVRSEIQEFTIFSREIQSRILIVFQDGLTRAWNDSFSRTAHDVLLFP